jgi:3-hydroxyisobutyrate dehydrogenase-like beta-hydroxyacid dehydrogenase
VLASGSTFASHTTGSPTTLHAFAERVAARDVHVVDAPFSGTPARIRAGTLTVLLGGTEPGLSNVERAVRAYAGTVIRTGELGSALVLKLLNNMVFAANVQLGLEFARLVDKAGIRLDTALDVLGHSSGGTTALDYLAAHPSAAAYADEVRPFLVKDVEVVERIAEALGLDLGLLAAVVRDGELDLSAGDS